MTRDEKLTTFQQLSKLPGIKTGTDFARSCPKARLLIDHPHAYRDWDIVGKDSVPGFYHLESRFRLDYYTDPGDESAVFHLCLHESEFERIQ